MKWFYNMYPCEQGGCYDVDLIQTGYKVILGSKQLNKTETRSAVP